MLPREKVTRQNRSCAEVCGSTSKFLDVRKLWATPLLHMGADLNDLGQKKKQTCSSGHWTKTKSKDFHRFGETILSHVAISLRNGVGGAARCLFANLRQARDHQCAEILSRMDKCGKICQLIGKDTIFVSKRYVKSLAVVWSKELGQKTRLKTWKGSGAKEGQNCGPGN